MRPYMMTLLLFLGLAALTLAVGAQEIEPAVAIRLSPQEQPSAAESQTIALEPVGLARMPGRAPFAVNNGSDSCLDATILTFTGDGGPVTSHTEDPGDPVLSCMWGSPQSNKGYRTTWYQITAPSTGVLTLDTLGSNFDTVLAVYSGVCGGLSLLSCNDDHNGFSSQTTFLATKGETYYVEVADWQANPPSGGATLGISASIEPTASRWEPDGVMALARSRHATAVVGDDIYVIGGQSGSLGTPVVEKRLDRFNTSTGNWERLADMPGTSGYANTTAAYVDGPNDNGRIYLPGGYTGNDTDFAGTHVAYDIAAQSWVTATDAWPGGTAIAWSAAVANPSETGYYLTGGLSSQPPFDASATVHDDVFFYSASTGSWSSGLPAMNSPRYAHTASLVGGRVCVAGGISSGNILLINGECHTPGSGTWTNTGNMSVPRYAAGSAVGPDGKWYVFGGIDGVGDAVLTTEVYDPGTNQWTPLDVSYHLGRLFSVPRAWPRGEFVGSTLWAMGGNDVQDNQAQPLVEKLLIVVPNHHSFLPLTASDYEVPDSTFGSAVPLTLNQSQQSDFDVSLDFYDVYRFDLASQKIVTATLTDVPSGNDLALSIYSANKFLLGRSNNPGPQHESVRLLLNAGSYYVMVERLIPIPQPGQNYSVEVRDQP